MRVPIPAIAIPAVVIALYFLVPGVKDRPWTAARVGGLVVAVAGFVLVAIARLQLGNSFTVIPEARELVTHGFYSRLRNPIYVFVDVMAAGLILFFDVPWLFVALAVVIVLQTIQARREGRVLEKAFGQRYIEYRNRTWF